MKTIKDVFNVVKDGQDVIDSIYRYTHASSSSGVFDNTQVEVSVGLLRDVESYIKRSNELIMMIGVKGNDIWKNS